MSEENETQPDINQPEMELSVEELDQVAGGATPQLVRQSSQKGLMGLLLPAVQVAAGDVNGDGTVEVNAGTL